MAIEYPNFEMWYFKRGIPADFWNLHAKLVEKTIEKLQLEVLQQHAISDVEGKIGSEQESLKWQLKNGGMKVPHLHFKGEIYLLNKKQWSEFSGEILKDFSKKLSETKTVSFGQLMDLSESINEIV
jgi:hypothetical protein